MGEGHATQAQPERTYGVRMRNRGWWGRANVQRERERREMEEEGASMASHVDEAIHSLHAVECLLNPAPEPSTLNVAMVLPRRCTASPPLLLLNPVPQPLLNP